MYLQLALTATRLSLSATLSEKSPLDAAFYEE
jgi:hypothetical protein